MIGSTVAQFKIEEQLGSGGMGIVYRATDTKLGRTVALKFLPPSLSSDPDSKARFVQEAKAASSLDHPNICTIYDIGEAEDGRLFIAMAHYDGTTLKYLLSNGPLEVNEALSISRQIAQGLQAAHEAGIVHRDIKPANLMVTSKGRVKILDFGVAKLEEGAEITKMGSTVGTAAYMSPEQATGGRVDPRSDLWSLGIVMYEMLAGAKPFDAGYDQALLYSILNEAPEPLSERNPNVPHDVHELVSALLQKDANVRVGSAQEVADRLSSHAGTSTRSTVRSSTSQPVQKVRFPWKKVGLGAGILAVVALLVWFVLPSTSGDSGPQVSDNTIAIFPFSINGEESIQYLDEGMITLLGTKLDGTDDLRTVDKTALLGLIAEEGEGVITPDRARIISARLLAGSFILGSVTKLANQIQIDATLYSSTDTVRVRVTSDGEAEMPNTLDELAIGLVTSRITNAGTGQLRTIAALTTNNFEALKAYLEGEKNFSNYDNDEAFESYSKAVELDSTFSLAWYRLAKAIRWGGGDFSTSGLMIARRDALDQALKYKDKLPVQYRTLIAAADAFEKGDVTTAQNLYKNQLERFPDQVETMLELGDLLYSYNPLYGRSAQEATPYYKRVLELEPGNREAGRMLFNLLLQADDSESVLKMVDERLKTSMEKVGLEWWTAFKKLYSEDNPDVSAILDSVSILRARLNLGYDLAGFAGNPKLADAIFATVDQDETSLESRTEARYFRQTLASSRGQVVKADSFSTVAGEWHAESLIDRVLRSAIPIFDASTEELVSLENQVVAWDTTEFHVSPHSVNEGHYGEIKAYLLGVLAAKQGDAKDLKKQIDYLSKRPDARTQGEAAFVFIKTLRAMSAWYAKNDALVMKELENSQIFANDICAVCSRVHAQTLNRFMRAEVLFSRGEYDSALQWYDSLWEGSLWWGMDHASTTYLRTAAAYEEQDNPAKAAVYYKKFIDLWDEADPRFQDIVTQARSRLRSIENGKIGEPAKIIIPKTSSK